MRRRTLLALAAAPLLAAAAAPEFVSVGTDGLSLVIRRSGAPGPLFYVPHDNENVGVRALETVWQTRPAGVLVELRQSGQRYIYQTLDGRRIWADPNRIYSDSCPVVRRELQRLPASVCGTPLSRPLTRPDWDRAALHFQQVGLRILQQLVSLLAGTNGLLVALHNNTDGNLRLTTAGASRIAAAEGRDGDDFFLVTAPADFQRLVPSGFNVALQRADARDDGSLSIWTARRAPLRYINIEAEHRDCRSEADVQGHLAVQVAMIEALLDRLAK